jgi:hypothetical protein
LKMQHEWQKAQKHLANFVTSASLRLGEHAAGLALYVHLVTYRAFMRTGARFRTITEHAVERVSRETAARIEALRSQPAPLNAWPLALPTPEPVVLAYAIEALMEPSEDLDELSDEEFWQVLHIVATAAECLHEAGTPSGETVIEA